MSRHAYATAVAITFAVLTSAAQAYQTFSGVDLDGGTNTRSSFTNSNAAEGQFASFLQGVGTETFESFAAGSTPTTLTFPGAGTATLAGSATVISQPTGTNGFGRYPHSGNKFVETDSTNFAITFSSAVAAFGFYAMDVGEFSGDLHIRLTLSGGGTQEFDVPDAHTAPGTPDGSALFFGVIAQNAGQQFTRVDFFDTNPAGGDVFAFDDMTVGSLAQVCQTGCSSSVPEPAGLPLLGVSLLSLAFVKRRIALRSDRQ